MIHPIYIRIHTRIAVCSHYYEVRTIACPQFENPEL